MTRGEADEGLVLVVRKKGYRDRTVRKKVRDGRLAASVTLSVIPPVEPKTPEPATPEDTGGDTPDGYKDDPY